MNSFISRHRYLLITAVTAFLLGAAITVGTALFIGSAALHLPGGAVGCGFSTGAFNSLEDKNHSYGQHILVGILFGILGFLLGVLLLTIVAL